MVKFVTLIQGVNDGQSHTPDDEVQGYLKGQNRKNASVRAGRSKRCVIALINFSCACCLISSN